MMRLLEKLYRSPLGIVMSYASRILHIFSSPTMIYGFRDPSSKTFRKYTRISNTTQIVNKDKLCIDDKVWIWHYSIIDATEGLKIGRGCQIGAWVGIFTHGSEKSIRLLGEDYINIHHSQRKGYTRGEVIIGPYTFIGAQSLIFPGVTIGKGCLIGAGAIVNKNIPDYSIVIGQPGKIVGSTMDLDIEQIKKNDYSKTYYDRSIFDKIEKMNDENIDH